MQIVKNKKGYAVRFYHEGVQGYMGGFASPQEAEEYVVNFRKQNSSMVNTKVTVGEFLVQWFEDYVAVNKAETTKKAYNEFLRIHAIPGIGNIMINKIKPVDVQQFYYHMRKKNTYKWKKDDKSKKLIKVETSSTLSNSTVLKMHRILHKAFQSAVALGYCDKNPCDFVTAPSKNKTKIVIPTDKELIDLYDALKDTPAFIMVYIASVTGMRLGEVAGLQESDVDVNKKIFYIQNAFQRVNSKMTLCDTKNHGSIRQIPMMPGTVEVLKKYIAEKLENKMMYRTIWKDSRHFCIHKDGKAILPEHVSKLLKKAIRKLKFNDDLSFHSLRHYHATWLLRQGVHPKIVSERLGHSSIKITLDTYTHLIPNLQEDVISNLDCKLFQFEDASKKQVKK